jgi:hypothetical protein
MTGVGDDGAIALDAGRGSALDGIIVAEGV